MVGEEVVAGSKVLLFIYGRLCRSKIERQDVEEMVADSKVLCFVCGRSYRNEVERQDVEEMDRIFLEDTCWI